MNRDKLFKKYAKHPRHTYELSETLSYKDDTGRTPDISFVYSGRNRGKSFEISAQCLADAWYDDKELAYVRRYEDTMDMIASYFGDKEQFISDMTDGQCTYITVYKSVMYFSHIEEDENGDNKLFRDKPLGRFFPLSKQGRFKSLQYPKIWNLIFEEVLTSDSYLPGEPEKLLNLISSISRSRPGFHTYLISNLDTPVNPYSNAWSLSMFKMKPGEVHLTKLFLNAYNNEGNEEYFLIAAHYLKDFNELSDKDKKVKKTRARTGIASNRWDEAKLYPVIDLKFIKQYDIAETVVFEYDDIMYQMDIIEVPTNFKDLYLLPDETDPVDVMMPLAYIRRKTSEPMPETRIYTNNPERLLDPYTTKGLKMVYKIDTVVAYLKENGWCAGSTNLDMNAFDNIYTKLKLLR